MARQPLAWKSFFTCTDAFGFLQNTENSFLQIDEYALHYNPRLVFYSLSERWIIIQFLLFSLLYSVITTPDGTVIMYSTASASSSPAQGDSASSASMIYKDLEDEENQLPLTTGIINCLRGSSKFFVILCKVFFPPHRLFSLTLLSYKKRALAKLSLFLSVGWKLF